MLYGVIDADLGAGTKATAGYRHQRSDIDGYSIFGLPSYSSGASLEPAALHLAGPALEPARSPG